MPYRKEKSSQNKETVRASTIVASVLSFQAFQINDELQVKGKY